ncbi:hypothetical protein BpHYR1_039412 [Brachionus plicatilis]|uniref:Uncharacterized protein n=1 Tax=Brachionus plicatilis TaxID=10195 RepID=A0A3M7R3A3_BRAPC|nr:hypothetical protein BpHYR1_039412 [Brachionus plicatilis]
MIKNLGVLNKCVKKILSFKKNFGVFTQCYYFISLMGRTQVSIGTENSNLRNIFDQYTFLNFFTLAAKQRVPTSSTIGMLQREKINSRILFCHFVVVVGVEKTVLIFFKAHVLLVAVKSGFFVIIVVLVAQLCLDQIVVRFFALLQILRLKFPARSNRHGLEDARVHHCLTQFGAFFPGHFAFHTQRLFIVSEKRVDQVDALGAREVDGL